MCDSQCSKYKPLFIQDSTFAITGALCYLNSLAPGRFEENFREVIFKVISVTDGWGISCKIALRWMPLNLTDDKSTLVQVMAWCCQATSHYLNQCWSWSLTPYGITRLQWVNSSPQDKMAAISQKIFSAAFLWMTSLVLWLKFNWT